MKTPDVTPAQILAIIAAVIALSVAFGAPISSAQQEAMIVAAGTIVPVVLVVADAALRRKRVDIAVLDKQIEAQEKMLAAHKEQ